jgi:hypothetical protein
MGADLISAEEHQRLLEKIDQLPFGDAHAGVYRAKLEELFEQFHGQLAGLFETIKAYGEVADLINRRQPLVNRKKYVRVRLRDGKTK